VRYGLLLAGAFLILFQTAHATDVTITLGGTVSFVSGAAPVAPGDGVTASITYDPAAAMAYGGLAPAGTPSEWTFGPGDLTYSVESGGTSWYADADGFLSVTNDGTTGDEIRYSACGPEGNTPDCGPYLGFALGDFAAPFDLLHSDGIPDAAGDIDFPAAIAQGIFIEVDGTKPGGPYQVTAFVTSFQLEGTTAIEPVSWGKVRNDYR
jgi:hypothetical protein